MRIEFQTHNEAETKALGEYVAQFLKRGDILLLSGDLGAGKTTFTGGIGKGLGLTEDVISPTFNIMKCYFKAKIPMYHIDAYRLEGQNLELGLEEYIEGDGVCLIEWPQFIMSLIPDERLEISIFHKGDDNREFVFESKDPKYDDLLKALKEKYSC